MNSTHTKAVQFKWTNISLVFTILMLFLSAGVFAQEKKLISGVINDNTNMPLPGVTITEVGTTNVSVTDMDGKFAMQV
ncbi:MAG: hypothetical protein EOO46_19005, partial [Flavobacterium sp.]